MADMESVVCDVEDLDEGIKDLFYELLGAAEDVDDIIHKLRESAWFQAALQATHCVQTLRATLAVQALRAKEKRRKQEEEKVESGKKKGASVKTATEKAKVDKSKKPSGKKKKNNKKNNKKKKEDKVEAAQAAYDDAELMEMMNTVERNLKKINTTL